MIRLALLSICACALGCAAQEGQPGNLPERLPATANTTEAKPAETTTPVDSAVVAQESGIALYPGATVTSSVKVQSDQIPSEEKRYRLELTTSDDPAKVSKYYQNQGRMIESSEGDKIQVMGFSGKGNQAIIRIEPEGKGSKVKASLIVRASK